MSELSLSKIRFHTGIWEGRITNAPDTGARPDIQVRYLDQLVDGVMLKEGGTGSEWNLQVLVPSHAVADGVHSFVIYDAASDRKLGDFTLIAGEAAADDLRAEVTLLRAELDMLKRAFRRHCLETN
ncbi:hypothetical protein [Parasedimentitalea psychrophila]|uniref:Uncharacterized protein n=1 Tax=Parasedimentitalea psychrophila TaxID=2997337 RepID=A0A9Y2L282_9RHOB|nr:hypothetical protein [Parasedimentitalea psychrophila]WIY26635.1 hypothetical protein QPJ95_06880 [Parasedimentitalea psychrophila]